MEKPTKNFSDFERDGVLTPVVNVAFKITNYLGANGINCDVQRFGTSLIIKIDESNNISYSVFNSVTEDSTEHGVVITFNEEEQAIRIAPFVN